MSNEALVIVIDDHERVRLSLRALLKSSSFRVKDYASAAAFLAESGTGQPDCLVVDVRMPEMSGLELQEELVRRQTDIPLIIVTGHGDVALAVRAMKAGAFDFLEKPFDDEALISSVERAVEKGKHLNNKASEATVAANAIAALTEREREVLKHLALGESNKQIAATLGISARTVEVHRANLQNKMQAHSLSDLVRIVRAVDEKVRQSPST